jgi:fructosamine-3-kinase
VDASVSLVLETALRVIGVPGPYRGLQPLSGGCISRAFRVETGTGSVFVKTAAGSADMFLRECQGLEALAQAGSSLRIPRVLGCHAASDGTAVLALEYLEPGPPAWEELGRGLAKLHHAQGPDFGFHQDTFIGATPQENGWMKDWAAFYSERRVGALIQKLEHTGSLSGVERKIYDRLLEKIPGLLAHNPTPSLLHGDLWSGNFLSTTQGPALIDPAVYFGDREAEWAMMRLFGGFPETVLEAYREVSPLPPDWRERQPLYQLYHLLNHQLLFGGSYGAQALSAAKRYL